MSDSSQSILLLRFFYTFLGITFEFEAPVSSMFVCFTFEHLVTVLTLDVYNALYVISMLVFESLIVSVESHDLLWRSVS